MGYPGPSPSVPKRFADPAAVEARLARLHEPHVVQLTELVERIRAARGGGNAVPWFDPDSGGVDASVLLLFEAPGRRAVAPGPVRPSRPGSGFVSPDNNDESAAAVFTLEREAGLRREQVLHWNIVPWYVGDGTKIRAVTAADRAEARPWLRQLIALLTNVRVVILCGAAAQKGWDEYDGPRPTALRVFRCPHPSPLSLNTTPGARVEMLKAFVGAASIVDSKTGPTATEGRAPILHRSQRDTASAAGGNGPPGDGVASEAAATTERQDRRVPPRGEQHRHAAPHPDAEFDGDLTPVQVRAQRCLTDLIARSPSGSIRTGHVEVLAELFDEWAYGHADQRDGVLVFTGKGGTGLWHVLQGLCPIDDPTRWNSLRAAVVGHLEMTGRWRRLRPPRGSAFELLAPPQPRPE